MAGRLSALTLIDQRVSQIFALVREALGGATESLLAVEPETGKAIVEGDREIDELTAEVDRLVWEQIERNAQPAGGLRSFVAILLILPELERSADLAEHIAQRAVRGVGAEMSPVSRGIVQQMSEVALEMWGATAEAYADRSAKAFALNEADEEMDFLQASLTDEVTRGAMESPVATEVALLGRFYERLGDHAVNLARRIERLSVDQS